MNLLKNIIKQNRNRFRLLLFVIIISNIITLVWNYFLSKWVNTMTAGKTYSVKTIPIILVFIFLMVIGNYCVTYASGWVLETINHRLRMGFVAFLLSLKQSEMEQVNAGDQMSLMQNEIGEVSAYIGNNLAEIMNTLITFVITLAFLIVQSPVLTCVITLPVIVTVLYVIESSKVIEKYATISQEKKQRMTGVLAASVNAAPMLYLYDCDEMMCEKHEELTADWAKASIREEKIRARLMSLSAVLSSVPLLLLLLVGGMLVAKGSVTIGIVYIFINLSKQISMPLMNMPGIIAGYRRFLVNINRLEGKIVL